MSKADDLRARAIQQADAVLHPHGLRAPMQDLARMLARTITELDRYLSGGGDPPEAWTAPSIPWNDDPAPHEYDQHPTREDEGGCLVCTVCGDHAGAPWHAEQAIGAGVTEGETEQACPQCRGTDQHTDDCPHAL